MATRYERSESVGSEDCEGTAEKKDTVHAAKYGSSWQKRTPSEEHINFKSAFDFADRLSREGSRSPTKSAFKPVYVKRHQPLQDFKSQSFEVNASNPGSPEKTPNSVLQSQNSFPDSETTTGELTRAFDQLAATLEQEVSDMKAEPKQYEKSVQVNSGTSVELAVDRAVEFASSAFSHDSPVKEQSESIATRRSISRDRSGNRRSSSRDGGEKSSSSAQHLRRSVSKDRPQGQATRSDHRRSSSKDRVESSGSTLRSVQQRRTPSRDREETTGPSLRSAQHRSSSRDRVEATGSSSLRSDQRRSSSRDRVQTAGPSSLKSDQRRSSSRDRVEAAGSSNLRSDQHRSSSRDRVEPSGSNILKSLRKDRFEATLPGPQQPVTREKAESGSSSRQRSRSRENCTPRRNNQVSPSRESLMANYNETHEHRDLSAFQLSPKSCNRNRDVSSKVRHEPEEPAARQSRTDGPGTRPEAKPAANKPFKNTTHDSTEHGQPTKRYGSVLSNYVQKVQDYDSDSDGPGKSSSSTTIKAEVHHASTDELPTHSGHTSAAMTTKLRRGANHGAVKIEVEDDSEPEPPHESRRRRDIAYLKVNHDPPTETPAEALDLSSLETDTLVNDFSEALDKVVMKHERQHLQDRRHTRLGASRNANHRLTVDTDKPMFSSADNLYVTEIGDRPRSNSMSEENLQFTHALRIQEKEHEGRRVIKHKRFVNPEMPGYVGFANLPNQVHRKSVKKGFEFTLMVVGESGLGKSTLVNSLFLTDLYPERHIPGAKEKLEKTVSIEASTVEIEERGVRLRLTVVDTPGFGDAMNNVDCFKSIIKYVDEQFEKYLNDESGLNRRNIVDNRVHSCFYFINPAGHGLKPLDISFMRALHHKVNIVPVIAKADTLTRQEVTRLKRKIMDQIEEHGISIYPLPDCDSDEDEDYKEQCKQLKAAVPFAVVGSNQIIEVRGRKVRGRTYPWGVVEVENPEHCDFIKLRTMLITHMQDLQEVTQEIHYENFRSQRLASGPPATRKPGKTPRRNEQDSKAQNDQGKLLIEREQEIQRMKEELVKMQQEMQRQRTASGPVGAPPADALSQRSGTASGPAPALPSNPPPGQNNNTKSSTGPAMNGRANGNVNSRAPVVQMNNV